MCLEEISASFLMELLKILSIVGGVTEALGREVSTHMSKIKSHPPWPESSCNSAHELHIQLQLPLASHLVVRLN